MRKPRPRRAGPRRSPPAPVATRPPPADENSAVAPRAGAISTGGSPKVTILGCLQSTPEAFLQSGGDDDESVWVEEMIQKRADAKKNKDFAVADQVRDELAAKGVVLRDGPEGTTWSKS